MQLRRLSRSRTTGAALVVCATLLSPVAGRQAPRLDAPPDARGVIPPISCATPHQRDPRAAARAVAAPDGEPLWFLQEPAILSPAHTGELRLREFLVAGEIDELAFERNAPDRDGPIAETWMRTATRTIAGRAVSVFEPAWPMSALEPLLARSRRGIDYPLILLGVVKRAVGGVDREWSVYLRIGSQSIPRATVVQVDETVQYSSHVVNLVLPEFGDGRLTTEGVTHQQAARRFYEHFEDSYEMLAIVPQAVHLSDTASASHINVKNDVRGIGAAVFDASAQYGSGGALHGVEFYGQRGLSDLRQSNHEITHQWGHYFDWARIAGLVRAGHDPGAHAPLMLGGETFVGAVLPAARRATINGEEAAIERTPIYHRHHPLELYAMGLVGPEEVGDTILFVEQGQFDRTTTAFPDPGTIIRGGRRGVPIAEVVRVHGPRSGPVAADVSRATILVSRGRLASQDEMDYWNFFSARMEDPNRSGILTYDGHPSFEWSTSGRVDVHSDIRPKATPRVERTFDVDHPGIGGSDCVGVGFEAAVPSLFRINQRVRVRGRVTAQDRRDFDVVMLRWWRSDGNADAAVRATAAVSRSGQFDLDLEFRPGQQGLYSFEVFLFWPDSGTQYSRCWITPVVVTE